MPRWWNIGFVTALLVTTGALSAHFALQDPIFEGEHEAVVAEYKEANNLDWQWASSALECQIYLYCVHIEVEGTNRCPEQIKVFSYLSDENDDWVDSADLVVDSPLSQVKAVIEVGVNRYDFEYFNVGDVRCTTGVPTIEAEL